jgi:5'-nucleotidase
MRYGIQNLSQTIFNASVDLAVSGFNVGNNAGSTVLISGTVAAAVEAVKQGIPSIAFSGGTGSQVGWETATQTYQTVYANLSTKLTNEVAKSPDKPYLPSGIWLNVNYPSVSSGKCDSDSQYTFVLSRINNSTGQDINTCGSTSLPTENQVISTGCFASVSVGLENKTDASLASQQYVAVLLQNILGCLP